MRQPTDIQLRGGVLVFIQLTLLLILLGRLVHMQIIGREDWDSRSLRNQVRTQEIAPHRGLFLDRKGRPLAGRGFGQVPPLNNRELFQRDRFLCAYCGTLVHGAKLTRDPVVPFSRGGRDVWMNVVTACRPCNERKSDRTPDQAHMELRYLPYVPNRAEYLILTNRRILADQMEFLEQHVSVQSRLHARGVR